MKTNEEYVRKIFSSVDLKRILKFPKNKNIETQDEKNILAVLMHIIITYFLEDISNQPNKYGLLKVIDLVPQYKLTRRGLLQTNQTNLDVIYFMNYQNIIYSSQQKNSITKEFYIVSEFGLTGQSTVVNKIYKKLLCFIGQRNFTRWYKKASVWLIAQSNYNLLPEEIKKYFNWNQLKFGPKA